MIKIIRYPFTGFRPRHYKEGIPYANITWWAWWKIYSGIKPEYKKEALEHIEDFKTRSARALQRES
jgi:hypothetical protein